jgi:potassium-transporting ATPase KdpC subunit
MKPIRTGIIVFLFWTIVAGGLYPLVITGVAALFFPGKANGSLVGKGGKVVGSSLLAQDFQRDTYFHPRPSAVGYNPAGSGASNQGYTSAQLKEAFTQRLSDWKEANGTAEAPLEMLYASGSGVDPDISPRAAELQVTRVGAARHLSAEKVAVLMDLVKSLERGPQLGFMGEPRVNVLQLNLALDNAFAPVTP